MCEYSINANRLYIRFNIIVFVYFGIIIFGSSQFASGSGGAKRELIECSSNSERGSVKAEAEWSCNAMRYLIVRHTFSLEAKVANITPKYTMPMNLHCKSLFTVQALIRYSHTRFGWQNQNQFDFEFSIVMTHEYAGGGRVQESAKNELALKENMRMFYYNFLKLIQSEWKV